MSNSRIDFVKSNGILPGVYSKSTVTASGRFAPVSMCPVSSRICPGIAHERVVGSIEEERKRGSNSDASRTAAALRPHAQNFGSLPEVTSDSHSSISGQSIAHVPKSAMCWYCVRRSIAERRIAGSRRKIGP